MWHWQKSSKREPLLLKREFPALAIRDQKTRISYRILSVCVAITVGRPTITPTWNEPALTVNITSLYLPFGAPYVHFYVRIRRILDPNLLVELQSPLNSSCEACFRRLTKQALQGVLTPSP